MLLDFFKLFSNYFNYLHLYFHFLYMIFTLTFFSSLPLQKDSCISKEKYFTEIASFESF